MKHTNYFVASGWGGWSFRTIQAQKRHFVNLIITELQKLVAKASQSNQNVVNILNHDVEYFRSFMEGTSVYHHLIVY